MKTTILHQNKTITVLTPVPYKVTAYTNNTIEELIQVQEDLDEQVLFLRNCFRLLGITNNVAIKNHYTLNIDTGERLYRIATEKWRVGKLSHEMAMVIRNHKW